MDVRRLQVAVADAIQASRGDFFLRTVAEAVSVATGDRCVIRTLSTLGDALDLDASAGRDAALPASVPASEPPYAGVLNGVAVSGDRTAAAGLVDLDGDWWIVLPLRAHPSVMGTLALTRPAERGPFHEDERAALQDVADRIGQTLLNHQMLAREERTQGLLDMVIRLAPVGIGLVDTTGRYLMVNDRLADLQGLRSTDCVGRSPRDLLSEGGDAFAAMLERAISSGQPVLDQEINARGIDRREAWTWVVSAFPIPGPHGVDGAATLVVDVSEERRARATAEEVSSALQSALARLTSVIENAPAGFGLFDTELRCVHVNEPLAAFTGVPVRDHLGRDVGDLLPDARPSMAETMRSVLDTGRAVEGLELSSARVGDPGVERHWLASCYPVTDGGGRRYGVGMTLLEITERIRAEKAARLLGAAGGLFGAESVEECLRAAAAISVPELADCCAVGLVNGAFEVEQVGLAHIDPVVAAGIGQWASARLPFASDLDEPSRDRLRAGRAVLVADMAGRGTELGLLSALVAPFFNRHQLVGVVLYLTTTASGRRFTERDVELAESLARRLGETVVHAQQAESERRVRTRLELLAAASTLLAGELDASVRADMVARLAVPAFADHASVLLLEPGGLLRLVGHANVDELAAIRWHEVSFPPFDVESDKGPAATTVRTGMPVVIRNYVYPDFGPLTESQRRELASSVTTSLLAVPLDGPEGPVGALVFCYGVSHRRYTDADVELARELAQVGGPAIAHALRFEHERATGEILQRSLLPQTLPLAAGVDTASRYLPGTAGLHVGGDWYDVALLGEGAVLLAIGDVVGHSIAAATAMGRFRTALQFASRALRQPNLIVRRVNEFMASDVLGEMATLLVAVVDPRQGTIELASAGHLAPILITPEGTADVMNLEPGPPIGVRPGVDYAASRFVYRPGSTLLLYTDGLIERRGVPLDQSIAELARACSTRVTHPEDLAAELEQALIPSSGPEDDVAMLVGALTFAGDSFDLWLHGRAPSLGRLRRHLRGWLQSLALADGVAPALTRGTVDDIVLAVNEAAANASEHAYVDGLRVTGGDVHVTGQVIDGVLSIAIQDQGRWRESRSAEGRGRGLIIMERVMDTVEFDREESGTTATLRRRLA